MPAENKSNKKEKVQELPIDLGDGLLLRWATADDAEALGAFNMEIHTDTPGEPEAWLSDWTHDLMAGDHPTTSASDFTVVVDGAEDNKIVSSLNLISQTWTYDGIPFGVGRVELVGTLPAYRKRGLIRQQMTAVHTKSNKRGELVQAIIGIPWYYRLFGYEMTLNFGGGRPLFWARRGNDKAQDEETYQIRAAVMADIPILEELYKAHCGDSLIVHARDHVIWQYELFEARRKTPAARDVHMIEDPEGRIVAYAEFQQRGNTFTVSELGVRAGHSWRAASLFLVRELKRRADRLNQERKKPISHIKFSLGETHAVYDALGRQLEKGNKPYAWYIRVADLSRFIHHIAAALTGRLAESVMAGHSGSLRLNFYRSNMRLVFERGELVDVGSYEAKDVEDADALFPDLTFLQLLFGYRSFEELDYASADCYAANAEAAVLLNCLFPRRPSDIRPLE